MCSVPSPSGSVRDQSGLGAIGDSVLHLYHDYTAKFVSVAMFSSMMILLFFFRSCLSRAVWWLIRRERYRPITTIDVTQVPSQRVRATSLIV